MLHRCNKEVSIMYYVGETFEDSKEYKTFENAKKAAEKKKMKIWDDEGNEVNEERTLTAENEQEVPTTEVEQSAEVEAIVIFDGLLNIRRRPSWDSDAVCGKAVKGQTYIVSEILDVDGKKMIRTFGDLYLTADEKYVRIEPI